MPAIANAYRGARVIGPLPEPARWVDEPFNRFSRKGRPVRRFTIAEDATLLDMRERIGETFDVIAAALGRNVSSIKSRYDTLRARSA